jgi:hypothetical protein
MHGRYTTLLGSLVMATALAGTSVLPAAAQGVTAGIRRVQDTVIIAPSAPPPPPSEAAPIAPPGGQASYWQPGHWTWSGANWVWNSGTYVVPPQRTATWVPGQWVAQPSGGYAWIAGHWQE